MQFVPASKKKCCTIPHIYAAPCLDSLYLWLNEDHRAAVVCEDGKLKGVSWFSRLTETLCLNIMWEVAPLKIITVDCAQFLGHVVHHTGSIKTCRLHSKENINCASHQDPPVGLLAEGNYHIRQELSPNKALIWTQVATPSYCALKLHPVMYTQSSCCRLVERRLIITSFKALTHPIIVCSRPAVHPVFVVPALQMSWVFSVLFHFQNNSRVREKCSNSYLPLRLLVCSEHLIRPKIQVLEAQLNYLTFTLLNGDDELQLLVEYNLKKIKEQTIGVI